MIQVRELSKSYGDVQALRGVSFQVQDRMVVGVLGLNGAGKSTLLRILAGELIPSSGSARIGDLELEERPLEARARVGYLPEDAPLYHDMRTTDFLRYMGRLRGLEGQALEQALVRVARATHIEHQMNRIVGELSMGYRKRVGIAQAILHQPDVVILDEPVASLDPAEIVGMREVIRGLGEQHLVLVSSHILSEVEETCEKVLVLAQGELVFEGSEEDLGARSLEQHRVELELRGDAEALSRALPEGARIEEQEPLPGGTLRAVVVLEGDRREELARAVAPLGLRRMVEVRSHLEQMFLKLTKEAQA